MSNVDSSLPPGFIAAGPAPQITPPALPVAAAPGNPFALAEQQQAAANQGLQERTNASYQSATVMPPPRFESPGALRRALREALGELLQDFLGFVGPGRSGPEVRLAPDGALLVRVGDAWVEPAPPGGRPPPMPPPWPGPPWPGPWAPPRFAGPGPDAGSELLGFSEPRFTYVMIDGVPVEVPRPVPVMIPVPEGLVEFASRPPVWGPADPPPWLHEPRVAALIAWAVRDPEWRRATRIQFNRTDGPEPDDAWFRARAVEILEATRDPARLAQSVVDTQGLRASVRAHVDAGLGAWNFLDADNGYLRRKTTGQLVGLESAPMPRHPGDGARFPAWVVLAEHWGTSRPPGFPGDTPIDVNTRDGTVRILCQDPREAAIAEGPPARPPGPWQPHPALH